MPNHPKYRQELDSWEGDPEELTDHVDVLTYDLEQCDRTFTSKKDAFTAGLFLGSWLAARDVPPR